MLGHSLYMRAIHGGKTKNDEPDSRKIALLLRGGMLPQAYVYPAGMRSTRDLLRRRMHLMRRRAETIVHVQNTFSQYNLQPWGKIHLNRLRLSAGPTGLYHVQVRLGCRRTIVADI